MKASQLRMFLQAVGGARGQSGGACEPALGRDLVAVTWMNSSPSRSPGDPSLLFHETGGREKAVRQKLRHAQKGRGRGGR